MGAMTAPGEPALPPRHVVLVRHARAESGEGGSDHDRRLTAAGHSAARAAGRWIAGRVPVPGLVWCSSAVRAVQTWAEIEAAVRPVEVRTGRDLYLASPRDVLARIGEEAPRSLLVVGHNPTMEQVVAALTGGLRAMRPGAVAVVDVTAGELVDLWEPAP